MRTADGYEFPMPDYFIFKAIEIIISTSGVQFISIGF